MRFHPQKLPVGAAVIVVIFWLATTVASAASTDKGEASTGASSPKESLSASRRYINAMNAIARMKSLLSEKRQPSKEDMYFVNIQREVAITHFQSLIGDIKLQSWESQVLLETLTALGRVPLYDQRIDGDQSLDLFGARVVTAIGRVPNTSDIQSAIERFESDTCESNTD